MMFTNRQRLAFLALLFLVLLLFVCDILIGSVSIPFASVFAAFSGEEVKESHRIILLQSRLPKAITALLAGASLSVSGLLMQTLFRNPLAGPYILGISSGSGLGVALLVMGGSFLGFSVYGGFSLSMAAVAGALLILLILFLASLKVRDVMTLLILGVMIGAIATAVIGMIQYFSSDEQLKSYLIWTLGSLSAIGSKEIGMVSAFLLIGVLGSFLISKPLNAFSMGEEYAGSLGFKVSRIRLIIILLSGWLAGIITAFCGPIGFIGIVVPHLARLLFATVNHFVLIPASVLIGMAMLLFSDLLSHAFGNFSLPINSVTAILGIPIIIWIILTHRKISSGF